MTKQEIRNEFSARRNRLSQPEYDELCIKLFQQFQTVSLNNINCIHLFLTIHERKEPDTYLIRDWLKANHPEIKIALPKINFADNSMQSFVDDNDLQLEVNTFGITEPLHGNKVDPTEIDLILVPLLAFDKKGYRVGYGKGFYDRFITLCRLDVQLIGLSFFEPVDEIDDVSEYDKRLTACIMPGSIIKF